MAAFLSFIKGGKNMFWASSKKHFIIGAKQVKNAIKTGKAAKVYIASDCDSNISDPVRDAAEAYNVEIIYISTRKELGAMCGIDVKASCAVETL